MEKWENQNILFLWLGIIIAFVAILVFTIIWFTKLYFKHINSAKMALVETKLQHQKILTSTSVTILERERNRIAMELHDAITSKLNTVLLLFEDRYQYSFQAKKIEECIHQVRHISHQLRPPLLEHLTIEELLSNIWYPIETQYEVDTYLNNQQNFIVNTEKKLHIVRVIQEVVNNVIKHAQANRLWFYYRETKTSICIKTQDDGIGFDTNAVRRGLGFRNIELRVQMLQGKYKFKKRNDGMVFLMQIPFE